MSGKDRVRRTACAIAVCAFALAFAGCTGAFQRPQSIWGDTQVTAPPASWKTIGAGFVANSVAYASIAVDLSTNTPYVAFSDSPSGNPFALSYSSGWGSLNPQFFAGAQAQSTRIAAVGGAVFVAYQDLFTDGINVWSHSPSWVRVGSQDFDSGWSSSGVALALDGSGTPYVAYVDASGTLKVQEWASGWQLVGNQSLFPASFTASHVSIAMDSLGRPWVAYSDGNAGGYATVRAYDGVSNWNIVGAVVGSASPGPVSYTALALDSFDVPYLAFADSNEGGRATVRTFTGGSWGTLRNAGFSLNSAVDISIAISPGPGGVPYVAYEDGNPGPATLMTLTSASWMPVGGAPGFSSFNVQYVSLALDSTGAPYVAFVVSLVPFVMVYR